MIGVGGDNVNSESKIPVTKIVFGHCSTVDDNEFQNHFIIKKKNTFVASPRSDLIRQAIKAFEPDNSSSVSPQSVVSSPRPFRKLKHDNFVSHNNPIDKNESEGGNNPPAIGIELFGLSKVSALIARFNSNNEKSSSIKEKNVISPANNKVAIEEVPELSTPSLTTNEASLAQPNIMDACLPSVHVQTTKEKEIEISAKPSKALYPFNIGNRRNVLQVPVQGKLMKAFGSESGTSPNTIAPIHSSCISVQSCLVTSPMDKNYRPIKMYLKNENETREPSTIKNSPGLSLLNLCEQSFAIPINLIFKELVKIQKVGEGVFGEVFVGDFLHNNGRKQVYKIVPIEGTERVNGEKQKTFQEILPEIVISKQLSKLHEGVLNVTDGYIRMYNARVVQGCYPPILVETWKNWNEKNKSDNDCPIFPKDQLYIIFEFDYGGRDAEAFMFLNAKQAFFLVLQVVHILAVGESSMEFEHRDLHWGNILVRRTESPVISYTMHGTKITVPSCGIKGCIIDFTIARIIDEDKQPVFLDLQNDEEQFLGTGDYQFDIYRMMRDWNRNEWAQFCPKTNTFWVHYFADKLLTQGRFVDMRSKEHAFFIRQLYYLKNEIIRYDSCSKFVFQKTCNELRKLDDTKSQFSTK